MSKGYFCLPMRDTLHSFQPCLFPAEIAFANSSSRNTKAVLLKRSGPVRLRGDGHPARDGEGHPPSPTLHLQLLFPSFLAYRSRLGGRDALCA